MTNHPKLYHELAAWWPLFATPQDSVEASATYRQILLDACEGRPGSVLELGAGGGNNAFHLKKSFSMTLTDRSLEMLAVSRVLNPECEHIQGDMRRMRLPRTFDAVFVQDSIMDQTSEADLRSSCQTAFAHLKPGGIALFAPDCVAETFRSKTAHGGHDGDQRALRYLSWTHDPNPQDTAFQTDLSFLLREEDGAIRSVQDRHVHGLFPRGTWLWLLAEAGFQPRVIEVRGTEVFLGIRPKQELE